MPKRIDADPLSLAETVKPGNLRNKSMFDILSGGLPMTGYLLCLVMLAITVANFVSYRRGSD